MKQILTSLLIITGFIASGQSNVLMQNGVLKDTGSLQNTRDAAINAKRAIADTGTNGAATNYRVKKQGDSLQANVNSKADTTGNYGIIYNKNTWTTGTLASDFTNNGATVSVVGGKLQFSGGTGTFTQSLDLNGYTCLEKFKITLKILTGAKTGTSYGAGPGIRSSNSYGLSNVLGRMDMTSGGTSGQLILNAGTSNTSVGTSATNVSYTAGEYNIITFEQDVDSIIVESLNYTTRSVLSRAAYQYVLPTGPFMHNTGHFAIFSLGGTFTVDSMVVESKETKNAPLMVIGDSKTQGYNTSAFYQRFGYMLGMIYTPTVIHAGGFDRTVDVLNALPEIIAGKPKNAILLIGSNDIRSGVDSSTYKQNYKTIDSTLRVAGINVWHTDLLYETSVSQSVLRNWILRTYSADSIISTYNPMALSSSYLAADNIHPTYLGNKNIYETIVSSGKIGKGNKLYDYLKQAAVPVPAANTFPLSNGSSLATSNLTQNSTTGGFQQSAAYAGAFQNALINTSSATNAFTRFTIGKDGTGNYGAIDYFHSAWTTSGLYAANSFTISTLSTATNGLRLFTGTTAPLILGVNSAAQLTISSTGLIGIGAAPTTDKLELTGNLSLMTAGNKLKIATGTNGSAGNATLVAGSVTVACNIVTASSLIVLTRKTSGGTIGTAITYTLSAGTSFTINSDNPLDTSTFTYLIIN